MISWSISLIPFAVTKHFETSPESSSNKYVAVVPGNSWQPIALAVNFLLQSSRANKSFRMLALSSQLALSSITTTRFVVQTNLPFEKVVTVVLADVVADDDTVVDTVDEPEILTVELMVDVADELAELDPVEV